MHERECVPFAPILIESMRSVGYSFPSAVADLLDNSVSAHAKHIDIFTNPSEDPFLVILDDGNGMTKDQLYEAMRYGSDNPLTERAADDLGRFGLGLKAASLSQCRKLVVISKCNHGINACAWDLDFVIQKRNWALQCFNEEELSEYPFIDKLKTIQQGTYIYLSDFDRIKEGTNDLSSTFARCIDDMSKHLSLVFHRYIEEGLVIRVNDLPLIAKDPFLKYHRATQKKRESTIYIGGEKITLQPYILPHISKLDQDDLDKVGGKENLKNEQGFYIYRQKRLIIWGTWFRLERKDELSKLARVMVDIPNSLDNMWSIDIKKSTAILPDIIKKNMFNAVYESVLSSEAVHSYRGRKEKKQDDIDYVWERQKLRDGYTYTINREIPQIKLLEETLNNNQVKMLDSIIKLLEENFPTSAVYYDVAKGDIEEKTVDKDQIEEIWAELQKNIEYIKENHLDIVRYYTAFLKVEPYCKYPEIKERIQMEIKKYE